MALLISVLSLQVGGTSSLISGPTGDGNMGGASSEGVVSPMALPGGIMAGGTSFISKRKPFISQISSDNTDVQDQIAIAAMATQNQGGIHKRRNRSNDIIPVAMEQQDKQQISIAAGETMMKSAELQLMTPLLHFLQLLCENHNTKLQVGTTPYHILIVV